MLDNRWVEATEYKYRWDKLDPYIVNEKASVYAGATGLQYETGNFKDVNAQFYYNYPSSDVWHPVIPANWGHISTTEAISYNAVNVRFDFNFRGTKFYDEVRAGIGDIWYPSF